MLHSWSNGNVQDSNPATNLCIRIMYTSKIEFSGQMKVDITCSCLISTYSHSLLIDVSDYNDWTHEISLCIARHDHVQ